MHARGAAQAHAAEAPATSASSICISGPLLGAQRLIVVLRHQYQGSRVKQGVRKCVQPLQQRKPSPAAARLPGGVGGGGKPGPQAHQCGQGAAGDGYIDDIPAPRNREYEGWREADATGVAGRQAGRQADRQTS